MKGKESGEQGGEREREKTQHVHPPIHPPPTSKPLLETATSFPAEAGWQLLLYFRSLHVSILTPLSTPSPPRLGWMPLLTLEQQHSWRLRSSGRRLCCLNPTAIEQTPETHSTQRLASPPFPAEPMSFGPGAPSQALIALLQVLRPPNPFMLTTRDVMILR